MTKLEETIEKQRSMLFAGGPHTVEIKMLREITSTW